MVVVVVVGCADVMVVVLRHTTSTWADRDSRQDDVVRWDGQLL